MSMSLVSSFLFPAPEATYSMHSFPNELVWIPRGLDYSKCQTGSCIPAIVLRCPAARYLIIYLHSNGEDVGLAYPFGAGLRMVLEVHVVLVEYPGYGICPGSCSEDSFWEAASAAFRFVTETLAWPAEDVIVMGRSLGAAVAVRLASVFQCHGVILVAPFLSLVECLSQYVGSFASMLVVNMFNNRERICDIKVPTLVIHGQMDRMIPCTQGEQLLQLCPNDKKMFVNPEDMSHNTDLLSNADYLIRPMLRFFALPDYSFVDLAIPAEAFDKRRCPLYHKVVEMVRDDVPLSQPLGDQEPCPACSTMSGPQGFVRGCQPHSGDLDDMDGSDEHTVRTPRPPRFTQHDNTARRAPTPAWPSAARWVPAPPPLQVLPDPAPAPDGASAGDAESTRCASSSGSGFGDSRPREPDTASSTSNSQVSAAPPPLWTATGGPRASPRLRGDFPAPSSSLPEDPTFLSDDELEDALAREWALALAARPPFAVVARVDAGLPRQCPGTSLGEQVVLTPRDATAPPASGMRTPGLSMLDIEGGILRYLHEARQDIDP